MVERQLKKEARIWLSWAIQKAENQTHIFQKPESERSCAIDYEIVRTREQHTGLNATEVNRRAFPKHNLHHR